MVSTKNILLIGRTGNGKSTLANVLTDSDEFTESADSISETKNIKTKKFEIDLGSEKRRYCVIDTIGVGDTQLDTKSVLFRLGEVANFVKKDGLNQIFFVTGSRFTKEEIEAYKLLSSIIFDQQVFNYTTIIRTNFPDFENDSACKRDLEKLRNENEELGQIFNSSRTRVIYVDNPALLGRPTAIALNKEIREESRKRLITYLGTISSEYYMPTNLDKLNERISGYMSEKERLEKELKEKDRMMKEAEAVNEEKIKKINAEMDKKIKELESKKNEEIRRLEDNLNSEIKRLEREGKANEKEIARLEKKNEEDKRKLQEDLEKEINRKKAENQKQITNDNSIEIIKGLRDEIKGLKAETEKMKEKVAEEVGKHVQYQSQQPTYQQPKDSAVVVAVKTATEVAALGTVSAVCPPLGAAATIVWGIKKIFF